MYTHGRFMLMYGRNQYRKAIILHLKKRGSLSPTAASGCGPAHQRVQHSALPTVPESPGPGPTPEGTRLSWQTPQSRSLWTQPTHGEPGPALGLAGPRPCPLAGEHKLWDTRDPTPKRVGNCPVRQHTHMFQALGNGRLWRPLFCHHRIQIKSIFYVWLTSLKSLKICRFPPLKLSLSL